jgi:hypothetical protein
MPFNQSLTLLPHRTAESTREPVLPLIHFGAATYLQRNRVTLIPGDGVGKEITQSVEEIFEVSSRRSRQTRASSSQDDA